MEPSRGLLCCNQEDLDDWRDSNGERPSVRGAIIRQHPNAKAPRFRSCRSFPISPLRYALIPLISSLRCFRSSPFSFIWRSSVCLWWFIHSSVQAKRQWSELWRNDDDETNKWSNPSRHKARIGPIGPSYIILIMNIFQQQCRPFQCWIGLMDGRHQRAVFIQWIQHRPHCRLMAIEMGG